ncbi:MAG: HEPN domain-containing protein [Clostridiales bacterium]|nr:HEPN domain-containing protein [Clostridiales bacterium]
MDKPSNLLWFEFAEDDLESAKILLKYDSHNVNTICFHAQQSAEKNLKGYLIANGATEPPHTRNLILLKLLCEEIDSRFAQISGKCTDLNPYSVLTEYPDLIAATANDAHEAIANAQAIMDFGPIAAARTACQGQTPQLSCPMDPTMPTNGGLRAYPKIIFEVPEKSGVEAFARTFPVPFRNFGICTSTLPYQTPEIEAKLAAVKDAVLSVVPDTEAIYLFGSYVNGKPHIYSDLDIYVIVPDSDLNPLKLEVAITSVLYSGDFRMAVDLIVKQSSKFRENLNYATFERVVERTGVRIYDSAVTTMDPVS